MNSWKWRWVALLVCLLLFGEGMLGNASAFAATRVPAVECYQQDCNGINPYLAGCSVAPASYWVVDSVPVGGTGGDAWIQLWFSGTCGTNWARYTCQMRCQSVTITLWICNSARFPVTIVQQTPATATAWTKQQYLPTTLAAAQVSVAGGGSTRTGCY